MLQAEEVERSRIATGLSCAPPCSTTTVSSPPMRPLAGQIAN
jgi:hypothetical protein